MRNVIHPIVEYINRLGMNNFVTILFQYLSGLSIIKIVNTGWASESNSATKKELCTWLHS